MLPEVAASTRFSRSLTCRAAAPGAVVGSAAPNTATPRRRQKRHRMLSPQKREGW
jgi:hypothetical protein